MTEQEIASALGLADNTVKAGLKPFKAMLRKYNSAELQVFESNRAKFLTVAEIMALQSLTDPKKHKAATLNNAAYTLEKITTAIRLEKGKSTQNIAQQVRGKADPDEFK
jgi:hypothetical protein